MGQLILFLLSVCLIGIVLQIVGSAIYYVFMYVILPIVALTIVYVVLRAVYYFFNPSAKKEYLERKAREAECTRVKQKQAETEKLAQEKQKEAGAFTRKREAEAAEQAREKQFQVEELARHVKAMEEDRRIIRAENNKELERQRHRDSDQQDTPYTYEIGTHANEALAIRYGIANQKKKVKEYWYPAQGGEMKRNPDKDSLYFEPGSTIMLRKTRKLSENFYEVLLTDFRDRPAKAVIEAGKEYVKTFYPLDDSWFEKHEELERTLKGNGSFTLKELATFHVQKIINNEK